MPHTDPARSFGVAVRHLFRHLDNVKALRRNPLARTIFRLDDYSSLAAEITCASIRSIILECARVCHAEDVAAGPEALAHRRLTIVSGLCSRRAATQIAMEIGVSLPQFYRDRRAICERVVRVLMTRDHRSTDAAHAYDPLRFGLWRVAALAEQGFAARAMTECERVLTETSRSDAKAHTLLTLGDTALRLGDVGKAESAVRAARAYSSAMTEEAARPLEIFARLLDFRMAMHRGRHHEARRMMDEIVRESGAESAERVDRDELRVDVLLDRCRFSAYLGDVADASDTVARASKIARRNSDVPLAQRVEIAVLAATFAQDGIVDASTRHHRLIEALSFAYSVGSAMGVLFASIGLAHQCVGLRDDERAKTYADQSLQIARSMEGRQSLLFAVASLAPVLLHLKRWSDLDPLLFEIESCSVPMTDLWTNLKLSQGAMLARRGRNVEALAPLSSAVAGAYKLQQPRSQAMALREFALSSYAAGRADDARDCIRSAVRIAETGKDALELQVTYQAASRILRDARMSRLAVQAANGRRM
jgi:tetratricopeptide (TPR) repeat protein